MVRDARHLLQSIRLVRMKQDSCPGSGHFAAGRSALEGVIQLGFNGTIEVIHAADQEKRQRLHGSVAVARDVAQSRQAEKIHTERQTVTEQYAGRVTALEEERRAIASQRVTDPLVAAAVMNAGLLVACVLPLVLCWQLLRRSDRDDPAGIVAAYREGTTPGSYLAVSHGTNDYQPKVADEIEHVYARTTQPGVFRSKAEVERILAGYELLEPGLVNLIHWRPEPGALEADPLGGDVARYSLIGGVGRRV